VLQPQGERGQRAWQESIEPRIASAAYHDGSEIPLHLNEDQSAALHRKLATPGLSAATTGSRQRIYTQHL